MKTYVRTFLISSQLIILKMKNILDQFLEKIETRISCSVNFFPENRVISEIKGKNLVQPYTPPITIWRMHFAYQTTKAADTHSESTYVITIIFPRQQWLPESASMLRYPYVTYTA